MNFQPILGHANVTHAALALKPTVLKRDVNSASLASSLTTIPRVNHAIPGFTRMVSVLQSVHSVTVVQR